MNSWIGSDPGLEEEKQRKNEVGEQGLGFIEGFEFIKPFSCINEIDSRKQDILVDFFFK